MALDAERPPTKTSNSPEKRPLVVEIGNRQTHLNLIQAGKHALSSLTGKEPRPWAKPDQTQSAQKEAVIPPSSLCARPCPLW